MLPHLGWDSPVSAALKFVPFLIDQQDHRRRCSHFATVPVYCPANLILCLRYLSWKNLHYFSKKNPKINDLTKPLL